jgi:hypothetical protein
MTMLYPIVLETEENGTISAYVPGLPVYAAADSHAKAERAIRAVLTAYLKAHPSTQPEARVRVARVSDRGDTSVGVAALVGARRTSAKARASRANGRLGGRPSRTRPRERFGQRPRADYRQSIGMASGAWPWPADGSSTQQPREHSGHIVKVCVSSRHLPT